MPLTISGTLQHVVIELKKCPLKYCIVESSRLMRTNFTLANDFASELRETYQEVHILEDSERVREIMESRNVRDEEFAALQPILVILDLTQTNQSHHHYPLFISGKTFKIGVILLTHDMKRVPKSIKENVDITVETEGYGHRCAKVSLLTDPS